MTSVSKIPAATDLTDLADRRGDSQLRRGLRIIDALALRAATAAEVARELDVSRSTALRLLQELEQFGLVERAGPSKRYSLNSTKLLGLVSHRDDDTDISDLVHPVLARLRDEFGEATVFAAAATDHMVYLAFFPSMHMIAVRERIGALRPMHASALGKAYLAGLVEETLDLALGRLTYRGGTAKAPADSSQLRAQVQAIRARGYAVDLGETFEGVSCVAAPVVIGGALIGAAGVSGPSARLTPDHLSAIGARLRAELDGLER